MKPDTRLAVLIDAENISHKQADRIFELVAPLGTAAVRRLYGDFRGPAGSWEDAAARHALDARQCFASGKGKNGADIALAVGATDLLRDGTVDAFCIVSSDSDFASLMGRIRAEGRKAFGIGRSTTSKGYQRACTEFHTLDPLPAASAPKVAPRAPRDALPDIQRALEACTADPDGSYSLSAFGKEARRVGINPKEYGCAGIGKLLKATGKYTVDAHHFRPLKLKAVAGGQ